MTRLTKLGPDQVGPRVVDALRAGAVVARPDLAVVELSGPGAVSCFQGVLTNDIEKPGDGAFVYGALLTPKGMIVTEGWAARLGTTVRFTVPGAGRERTLDIFTRSIPPRLARVTDRTEDTGVIRVAGPRALALTEAAGIPVPAAPGRVAHAAAAGVACEVARASETAPFALQLSVAAAHAEPLEERLAAAGALRAGPEALDLARIVAGWPALASEVDDKTIPQEVRFDEIGGVSYTKGCYTGQETVSRLHFRGHANRRLQGLVFDGEPAVDEGGGPVIHLDREVGRVTSVAWLPDDRAGPGGAAGGRWIGLAMVRREVPSGAVVRAGAVDARVVELPLSLLRHEPA
ncbi:MAG: YgfZ/GcvT domain-containing protein [Gemmatimonadales bacterium]